MPIQITPFVQQAFVDPAIPSLQVGGALGASSFVASGIIGHSAAFTTAVGLQFFYLGTTTYYLRHSLLIASQRPRTQKLEIGCSGLAGALSGALTGALNKGSSVFRPALLAGTFGMGAQIAFHAFRNARSWTSDDQSFTDRIARVLPLKSLSDGQYESMLREKVTKINVEISMLDDQIAELKKLDAESSSDRKT